MRSYQLYSLLAFLAVLSVGWPPGAYTVRAPQGTGRNVRNESTSPVVDRDADGLEDALEAKLGTNPRSVDTDGDSLSDYEEYCKYRTDPTKKDSDGDGTPDGDWEERREWTYTIRALYEIRPPNDMKLMADLYQDMRRVDRPPRLKDQTVVELLLFPFSTPHIYGRSYPRESIPESQPVYLQRTLGMNFSPEMQKEVKEIVRNAATDIEAIETILSWIANETRLVDNLAEFGYFYVIDNEIVWHNSPGDAAVKRHLLETHFYGDSMFKKRLHGTCSSMATLRATMLRAAGLPTRLVQTLPLINRYEGDPEPLVDRMRNRRFAKGYERYLDGSGSGANHLYNEVFLNHHWIRVDQVVNTGPFVGDKVFVKVYDAADWNNLFTVRPPEDLWNENRDFRPLDVSDLYAKYKSEFETLDIAIADSGLSVTKLPDGRFSAAIRIRNTGNKPSPSFPVNFYAGDPQKGGRLITPHAAGPILPGGEWVEGSGPFTLREGETEVFVVIDPANAVAESDETNNRASKAVGGKPGVEDPDAAKAAKAKVSSREATDVWIAARDIVHFFHPADSSELNNLMVGVVIHSTGAGILPQVASRFYLGDPEKGGKIIGTGLLKMEAGQTASSATGWNPGGPGEYEIFVVVDPENVIAETDETNNRASRTLKIDPDGTTRWL